MEADLRDEPKRLDGQLARQLVAGHGPGKRRKVDFIIVVTAFAALAGLVLPLALMLTVGLWGKERVNERLRRRTTNPPSARQRRRAPLG